MARNHGRILTSIWRDDDFLALAPSAQRLFLFLISQPELNHAGLLPLRVRRWVPKAAGLTVGALADDLAELAAREFVVVDEDTEELLVRTHVKNDGVFKQPKLMSRLAEDASHIESVALRVVLARELARLPLDEVSDTPPRGGGDPARLVVEKAVADLVAELAPADAHTQPDTRPDRGGDTQPDTHPDRDSEQGSDTDGIPIPVGVSRAGARVALPPAPIPLPPTAGADAPPDDVPSEPATTTAQTLVAEWIDRCSKRPPPQTIKRVGRAISEMLGDGIDPDDVRRGLAHWKDRGLDPSVLPGVVNEVMNAAPDRGRHPAASSLRLDPSQQDYSKARI